MISKKLSVRIAFPVILLHLLLLPCTIYAQSILYNDSHTDTLFVANDFYEIGFLKSTGEIAIIKDLQQNQILVSGGTESSIWDLEFKDFGILTVTEFLAQDQNRFEYEWNETDKELLLHYSADPGTQYPLEVSVKVLFSDTSYFDLQLSLINHWQDTITKVGFPNNLALLMEEADSAVLPGNYPGMILFPEFFKQRIIFQENYPDYMHADYVSVKKQSSTLSIYSLNEGFPIIQTYFGFFPNENPTNQHNYSFVHNYTQWIEPGSSWITPVSRFRIGETTIETLHAYRIENKIDRFPSLKTKLGDQFDTYAQSPLDFYHYHIMEHPLPFKELPSLIGQVTSPAIVMLTAYYTGGYHGHFPDYLPPNPSWGTPTDFADMISQIKAQGKKTMLFTIPTWWNDQSPTMLNLDPTKLPDIARIDMGGNPMYSSYHSDTEQAGGYLVSPFSPLVRSKMQELLNQTFQQYGVDIIYDDVLGTPGAGYGYDFNKYAPSPIDFYEGWLDYLENDQSGPHFVEFAYDKMTKFAIGSIGQNRFVKIDTLSYMDHQPEKPIWNPYPTAPFLYNDIMASYTWGTNPGYENLSYNLQFAVPLGILIGSGEYGDPGGYWDRLIRTFQSDVSSKLYGKLMVDYTGLPGAYSIADYGDIKVTKNWNFTDTLHLDNYSLPPSGVLVESDDGSLVAGIFSGFNGEDLSGEKAWEDHYIIQLTTDSLITIKHPNSNDTPIHIRRPSDWLVAEGIKIRCTTQEGTIGEVSANIEDRFIRFDLNQKFNNETVDFYEISYHPETGTSPSIFLFQNYPNPFTEITSIEFVVTSEAPVNLSIYNSHGQLVKILTDKIYFPGTYVLDWYGNQANGAEVPPGIYLCQLVSDEVLFTHKMVKIR